MRRWILGLSAAFGIGALPGCFQGVFMNGQPCQTDEECGPLLFCKQGFCGGPRCQVDFDDSGVCPCPGPFAWSCDQLSEPIERKVDVLLVIDNGDSKLLADQARIARLGEQLHHALNESLVDYRIGITTTDAGNMQCSGSTPELGRLVFANCRQRLGDFTTAENDASKDCIDACGLDPFDANPTLLEPDGEAAERPWLQGDAVLANVGSEEEPILPEEALACLVPQGITGCEYGQPMEAMHWALERTEDVEDPAFGFLRDDAHLAVIFVTDGVDCSHADESIFDPNGAKSFWADPGAASPTPAICWNAGVACSGGPGVYDGCEVQDFAVDGSTTDDEDDAVLQPVDRYIGRLQSIADAKKAIGADLRVVVSVLTGVPEDFPDDEIVFQDATGAFADEHGIAPGCGDASGAFALPPVRLRALAEAFPGAAGDNLSSACGSDDTGLFAPLQATVGFAVPNVCVEVCARDYSESQPGVQPECAVASLTPEGLVDIPHCGLKDGKPAPVDDQGLCYYERVGDQVGEECRAGGANLEFGFLVGAATEPPGAIYASCSPSPDPEVDCPSG